MTKEEVHVRLQRPFSEAVLLDGMDAALIGYIENDHAQARALYDLEKCVDIMRERLGWTFAGANDILRDALTRGWCPGGGMPAFAVLVDQPPQLTITTTFRSQ